MNENMPNPFDQLNPFDDSFNPFKIMNVFDFIDPFGNKARGKAKEMKEANPMNTIYEQICNAMDELNDDQLKELLGYAQFILNNENKDSSVKQGEAHKDILAADPEDGLTAADVNLFLQRFKNTDAGSREWLLNALYSFHREQSAEA